MSQYNEKPATVFDEVREDVREEMKLAREAVRISRERQNQPPQTNLHVPAGWKLVPIDPTEDMSRAWNVSAKNDQSYFSRSFYADMLAAAPPAPQELLVGWTKVPAELPQALLRSINRDNQVLAYENGRYFNAWFEFEASEGGWFWMDDADSEPNPSHYCSLPAEPPTTEGQP